MKIPLPLSQDEMQALVNTSNPHSIPPLVNAIDRLQEYLKQIRILANEVKGSHSLVELKIFVLTVRGVIDRILPED